MVFHKSIYLTGICLLSLAGCGGGGSSSTPANQPAVSANDSAGTSSETTTPGANSPTGNTRISKTVTVFSDLDGSNSSTSTMNAIYDDGGRLVGEFLEVFIDGKLSTTTTTARRFDSEGQLIELVAETDNVVDDIDDILSVNTQQWQYNSQGLERTVFNTRYGAAYNLGDDSGVTEYQYTNGQPVRSIATTVSSQGIESTQDRTLEYRSDKQLSRSQYTNSFDGTTGYTEHLYNSAGQLIESTGVSLSPNNTINKSVSRYISQDNGYVTQVDIFLDDELTNKGTITTTYESGVCIKDRVTDGVSVFGLGLGFPFQDVRCITR